MPHGQVPRIARAGPNLTTWIWRRRERHQYGGHFYLIDVVFIPVTAGGNKGSVRLLMANTSGITPNSYVVITRKLTTADGNLLQRGGIRRVCSYCGHDCR